MTDDGRDLASESWRFALQLYAEPGISDACLKLQAEAGVDVMMLLVATFAAAQKRIDLSAADIASMDAACRPWREQIVHPLRAMRMALKSGPAPAPTAATEKLRSQIKASELAAERLENDFLAAWLQRTAMTSASAAGADSANVMHHVVLHALGAAQHHRIEDLKPAMATILSATDKIVS